MTVLQFSPRSRSQVPAKQILTAVETKLFSTKTYQHALAALDTDVPPARSVLEAHLRAVSRTSIRLALAELQATESPEIDPHPETASGATAAAGRASERPTEATPALAARIATQVISTSAAGSESRTVTQPISEQSVRATAAQPKTDATPTQPKPATATRLRRVATAGSHVPPPPAANGREAACQAVGSALKQARLERSLGIDQLAARTLIQPHRIVALEAGQLAQVEEDVYLRGFVQRLARALDLEPLALLDMLPKTPPVVYSSWLCHEPEVTGEQTAQRYISYTAAVAALLGGLAWVAEAAAAPPSLVPTTQAQVQPTAIAAAPLLSLTIAPPEV